MAKKKSEKEHQAGKDRRSGRPEPKKGSKEEATAGVDRAMEAGAVAAAFRFPAGTGALADLPTTPLKFGPRDKAAATAAIQDLGPALAELQEKLYAQSTAGSKRRVLLLLQGMDTAGKDGVITHAVGLLNPSGIRLVSFKSPTAEEREHDFLWRIQWAVPRAGEIGVFNRSQYEDVLIVRVHELVSKVVWARRYAKINAFERELARQGVTMIKCFLHVSKKTQAERLLARLEDPAKYWKYNPSDVDERGYWDEYQAAYLDALRKCSTVAGPWYVIPSDKKWYRNWAVAALLQEKLAELGPQYPAADYDVEAEKKRVAES